MNNPEKMTFERLPEMMFEILERITELGQQVEQIGKSQISANGATRRPINIDEVCKLLGKAKPTVYALASQRKIPCYKCGKKLYFYEDEILRWLESGRRATYDEIRSKAINRRS